VGLQELLPWQVLFEVHVFVGLHESLVVQVFDGVQVSVPVHVFVPHVLPLLQSFVGLHVLGDVVQRVMGPPHA